MTYRVLEHEFVVADPAPFENCHASTLVVFPNGEVLAAWFAGTREGHTDVDIWYARKTVSGWSKAEVLVGEEGIPCWNPVLFQANDNRLLLFYKIGHTIPEWYTMVMESMDNGHTWSKPVELVPGDRGGRGPVRNHPIHRSDGAWLAPASIEDQFWDAFIDISEDGGKSWSMSGYVPIKHASPRMVPAVTEIPVSGSSLIGKGIIQPALWESKPGHVHMLLRSTEGQIYRSDSSDGGASWSPAYATALPNNNSGIDLTKLANGTLALVYNPVEGDWAARTPLVLRISRDNGETWKDEWILENEQGEYSYPAILSAENELHITYTWKRENIVYWRIVLE